MANRIRRGDLAGLDALDAESLALPWFSDQRPLKGVAGYADWRLNGFLSRTLGAGLFTGALGDVVLMPPRTRIPCQRVFLFGLGPRAKASAETAAQVVEHMRSVLERARAGSVAVGPPLAPKLDAKVWLAALAGFGREVLVLDPDGSFA